MKTIADFRSILNEIYLNKEDDFSGIGLIVYKSVSGLPISSLKSINSTVGLPISTRTKVLDFLIQASCNKSKYHDGFHLLNERLELTHISQYISPAIVDTINVQYEFGSRYRTAVYSSFLPNVIACGVLSNSYPPTIFVKGEVI